MIQKKHNVLSLPILSLVFANLIPLIGVFLWGWQVDDLVLLYWFETAIIGFFNVVKMLVVGGWSNLFFIPFFVIHFSGFMTGHLFFLLYIFAPGLEVSSPLSYEFWLTMSFLVDALYLAIIGLFISHGISFIYNFVLKGEYKKIKADELLLQPYGRIAIMHVSIVFIGFIALATQQSILLLILLIIVKTVTDIQAHLKVHKKRQSQ